jgi:hypothetical protein
VASDLTTIRSDANYVTDAGEDYRMHIIARCPRCGYRWYLNGTAADRRLRCRKCWRLLKIPDLTEVPDAASLVQQARSEVYVDESGRTFG